MFVGIKRLKAIFNLPQQGIPYIYKGWFCSKCNLFKLLSNNAKVKWKSRSSPTRKQVLLRISRHQQVVSTQETMSR